MRRFEVVVRTKVNGVVKIRTAESLARNSIDAMCQVVRLLGVDGPITSSVKLVNSSLNGGLK